MTTSSSSYAASVRPGIVHRLDKGTTGLLVVAKVRVSFHFFFWWLRTTILASSEFNEKCNGRMNILMPI